MHFSFIAALVSVAAAIGGAVFTEQFAVAAVLLVGGGLATRVILAVLERHVRDARLASSALSAPLKFVLTIVLITLSVVVGVGFSVPFSSDGGAVLQGLAIGAVMAAVLWSTFVSVQQRATEPAKRSVEQERAVAPQSERKMPAAPSTTRYVLAPFFGLALTVLASFVLIVSDLGGDYGPRGLGTAFDWFMPMWVGFTFMVVAVQERLFQRVALWVNEHPTGTLSMAIGAIVAVVAGAILYRVGVSAEELRYASEAEAADRLRFVALFAVPLGIGTAVATSRLLRRRLERPHEAER